MTAVAVHAARVHNTILPLDIRRHIMAPLAPSVSILGEVTIFWPFRRKISALASSARGVVVFGDSSSAGAHLLLTPAKHQQADRDERGQERANSHAPRRQQRRQHCVGLKTTFQLADVTTTNLNSEI